MLGRRPLFLILAILLVFGGGIGRLFVLRFSRGDIYPAYSSFRADPLGGKALFDSLKGLPELTVQRNQSPLELLENNRRATLLYSGVPVRYFSSDSDFLTLQKIAASGNRVVIGFQPTNDLPRDDDVKEEDDQKKGEKPSAESDKKNSPAKDNPKKKSKSKKKNRTFAPEIWQLEWVKLPKRETESILMTGVDQPLSFHSHLGFLPKHPAWKTLYSVEQTPVIVERNYGLGSLVLLADCYPLSNEALRKDRRPALLATLLGSERTIIFDETHFGILERPGVAALARRYRLHGVAVVCLLLVMLFLWKNLTPWFPRQPDESSKEIILSGQTAHAGLISLLRRSVGVKDLPAVCFAEWIKSAPRNFRPGAVAEASVITTQTQQSPLESLAKLNSLLNQQKHVKQPR